MCLQNGALNSTNIIVTKATVTKMVNNVKKTDEEYLNTANKNENRTRYNGLGGQECE